MTKPLRLMFFDDTCVTEGKLPVGLTHAWRIGGALYHRLGRIDAWHGVSTWEDGLDWLIEISRSRTIAEIQFWGHGEWGGLWIDEQLIKIDALDRKHRLHDRFATIKTRLTGPDALWWFRCCDVFGTELGHDFARRWTRFFGCRAAGHTHQIMFFQSGLHMLRPGEEPTWSVTEGVVPGLDRAINSSRKAPHTITCLHNEVPR